MRGQFINCIKTENKRLTIESSQELQDVHKTIIQVKLHQIPNIGKLATHDKKGRKIEKRDELHEEFEMLMLRSSNLLLESLLLVE